MTTEDYYTIRPAGGYIDLAFDNRLPISGEWLGNLLQQLEERFSASTSAGMMVNGEFFGVRLHGAKTEVAEALRSEGLLVELAIGDADEEAPHVRYEHEGRAYVDPKQVLPLGRFLAGADQLIEATGKRAELDFRNEQLCYEIVRGGIYRTNQWIDPEDGALLRQHLQPSYVFNSGIHCGIHEGRWFVQLKVPNDLELALVTPERLGASVLTEPAPLMNPGRHSNEGTLWVYLDGEPEQQDARGLWAITSQIALGLGIHPVGDFSCHPDKRERWIYTPPALSSRP